MQRNRQKRKLSFIIWMCAGLLAAGLLKSGGNVQAAEPGEDVLCYNDIVYISWRIWNDRKEFAEKRERELKHQQDEWQLVLVNREHPLEEDYEVVRAKVANNQYVDERIADPLNRMLEAAKEEGVEIQVISGYRSYKRQADLYQQKIRRLKRQGFEEEEAIAEAGTVVAVPGTSEHMTGLAVDLVSANNTRLEEEQEDTEAYQWLLRHCMEYGFIVRYPESKKDITGIIYEPWHFRYVGEEHAGIIMENGWCLEEYIDYYYQKEMQEPIP